MVRVDGGVTEGSHGAFVEDGLLGGGNPDELEAPRLTLILSDPFPTADVSGPRTSPDRPRLPTTRLFESRSTGEHPHGATIMHATLSLAVTAAICAGASASTWDRLLSDSSWYVPRENLLAYMTSTTSFIEPPPLVLWDQTLWSLGDSLDGHFTGSAQATFFVTPEFSFSSTTSIVGIATESGQIRMRFTSTSDGSTVIGVGQFREVDGATAMQMQMISGQAGSAYTTHWAYMLSYDPKTFTPPDPLPNGDLISMEWAWTLGTTWNYQSDQLFGPGGVGSFTITNYRNGYFWGAGTGPDGSSNESFTLLGSITPEGNVLFNVLAESDSPTLVTLAGQVTGGPLDGCMVLRTYEFSGSVPAFGPEGFADLVPQPPCAADVNDDGRIDGVDLAAVLAAWGTNGQGKFDADVNGDGIVDDQDLAILLGGWGTCE